MAEDGQTAKRGTNEDASREDEEKVSRKKLASPWTTDRPGGRRGVALLGAFILIEARDIGEGSIPDPITSRGLANSRAYCLSFLALF